MHKYPSITRFQQHTQLKDYRESTRYRYVHIVRQMAEYFHDDPAQLTEEQVREYFLYLRQDKKWQGSAMTQARAALRAFYRECLSVGQDWTAFEELRIARTQPLPVVLSREEVARVLGVLREPRFRTCLRLIYHCGLRIGEAVSLAPRDIHGRENPPRLHIKNAKGGKDRYVPIAIGMVDELREWWRIHQDTRWLFPGRPADRAVPARSCMPVASVQNAFALARQQSGIHPQATVHTLRHCYATHLLEAGINIRQLRDYLGHNSILTTMIYTHLTQLSETRTQATLQHLYQSLPS